jgi:hypothetical protein
LSALSASGASVSKPFPKLTNFFEKSSPIISKSSEVLMTGSQKIQNLN